MILAGLEIVDAGRGVASEVPRQASVSLNGIALRVPASSAFTQDVAGERLTPSGSVCLRVGFAAI